MRILTASARPRRASDGDYAKFRNDAGAIEIRIGLREFECIGASPPHDHPHIYLDMGDDDAILCPYCATLFRFDSRLNSREADPPDALYSDHPGGWTRCGRYSPAAIG